MRNKFLAESIFITVVHSAKSKYEILEKIEKLIDLHYEPVSSHYKLPHDINTCKICDDIRELMVMAFQEIRRKRRNEGMSEWADEDMAEWVMGNLIPFTHSVSADDLDTVREAMSNFHHAACSGYAMGRKGADDLLNSAISAIERISGRKAACPDHTDTIPS